MNDTRDFESRLNDMRKELVALCKKYDIEITARLSTTHQAIIAQIIFLDLNDPVILEKYGLKRNAKPIDSEPDVNPIRD
jgi:hypothetical protein